MTSNQINYQRNVEQARTNRANEGLRGAELAETNRHNVVGENETHRHNVADEGIRTQSNYITAGHYSNQDAIAASRLAQDLQIAQGQLGLGYANLQELARNNAANLAELSRHNQAQEGNAFEQLIQRALSSNNLGGYLYYLSQGRTLSDLSKALGVDVPSSVSNILEWYSNYDQPSVGAGLAGLTGSSGTSGASRTTRSGGMTSSEILDALGYTPNTSSWYATWIGG